MITKFFMAILNIAVSFIGFVVFCTAAGFYWSIATRAFQFGSF
jgi:hypothetical protein